MVNAMYTMVECNSNASKIEIALSIARLLSFTIAPLSQTWQERIVKVGVPKKVVFSKISAHVSVSNKSIS
jgi:hypothetical protein